MPVDHTASAGPLVELDESLCQLPLDHVWQIIDVQCHDSHCCGHGDVIWSLIQEMHVCDHIIPAAGIADVIILGTYAVHAEMELDLAELAPAVEQPLW